MHRTIVSRYTNSLGSMNVVTLSENTWHLAFAPSATETGTARQWPLATRTSHWLHLDYAPLVTASAATTLILNRLDGFRVRARHVRESGIGISSLRHMAVNVLARSVRKQIKLFSPWSILDMTESSIERRSVVTRMPISEGAASRKMVTRSCAGIAMQALDSLESVRTLNN